VTVSDEDHAITQLLLHAVRQSRTPPLRHAAIPDSDPPVALCGTRIKGQPSGPAGERCAVCLDLTQRNWGAR
jgi:hypothetical protein